MSKEDVDAINEEANAQEAPKMPMDNSITMPEADKKEEDTSK